LDAFSRFRAASTPSRVTVAAVDRDARLRQRDLIDGDGTTAQYEHGLAKMTNVSEGILGDCDQVSPLPRLDAAQSIAQAHGIRDGLR
jgi:hypothetical protein